MAPHHHPRRHRCDPAPTGPAKQDPCSWSGSPQTSPQISTHTGAPGDRTSTLLHREGATPSSRSPHRSQPSERGFGNRAGDAPQASPLRASGGVGGQTACWKGAGARQASRPGMQHAHSAQHTHSSGRASARPGGADGHHAGAKPGLGPAHAAPPPGLWRSQYISWGARVCSKGRQGEKRMESRQDLAHLPQALLGRLGQGIPQK